MVTIKTFTLIKEGNDIQGCVILSRIGVRFFWWDQVAFPCTYLLSSLSVPMVVLG